MPYLIEILIYLIVSVWRDFVLVGKDYANMGDN